MTKGALSCVIIAQEIWPRSIRVQPRRTSRGTILPWRRPDWLWCWGGEAGTLRPALVLVSLLEPRYLAPVAESRSKQNQAELHDFESGQFSIPILQGTPNWKRGKDLPLWPRPRPPASLCSLSESDSAWAAVSRREMSVSLHIPTLTERESGECGSNLQPAAKSRLAAPSPSVCLKIKNCHFNQYKLNSIWGLRTPYNLLVEWHSVPRTAWKNIFISALN